MSTDDADKPEFGPQPLLSAATDCLESDGDFSSIACPHKDSLDIPTMLRTLAYVYDIARHDDGLANAMREKLIVIDTGDAIYGNLNILKPA